MSSAKENKNPPPEPAVYSTANTDVYEGTGPEEGVFLSNPYYLERMTNAGLVTHKCWAIVVLSYTWQDAKQVTAKAVKAVDADKEQISTIRIRKNKYPAFFFGNRLNTFCDTTFKLHPEAAKGFSGAMISMREEDNEVLIDVHFGEGLLANVTKTSEVHLKFLSKHKLCHSCMLRDVLELPNVVAFEVEAIKFQHTAENKAKGTQEEAVYDSE